MSKSGKQGMKKLGWPVIALISVVLVVSFLLPNGSSVSGISEGTYSMSAGHEEMVISFNLTQNRFGISNNGGKTWYLQGSFILNGQIVATTDDGENTYVFDVIDNDKIRYVYTGDSEIVTGDGETLLYNGAIFRYDNN